MKVYIVTDADIELLLASIDRDPKHGERGGSAAVQAPVEQEAHDKAHRFFNYQVRTWLDGIKRP